MTTIALVTDHTLTIVSRSQGRVWATSAWPAQMSTTISPSTVAAKDAPISSPRSKLEANASRTPANLGSYVPCTVISPVNPAPFILRNHRAFQILPHSISWPIEGQLRRSLTHQQDAHMIGALPNKPELTRPERETCLNC